MRNLLLPLLLLAGPLLATDSGCENKREPLRATNSFATPKAGENANPKHAVKPAKSSNGQVQANARIREGRRPSAPKSQRPAHLFM